MTIATYSTSPPPAYSYNFNEGYRTLISEFDSGVEQRRNLLRFPKKGFDLVYKVNTASERATIQNFFHNRKGQYDPFYFRDFKARSWVDEYVGRGGPFDPFSGLAFAATNTSYTNQLTAITNATTEDVYLLPNTSCVVNDAYYVGMKHPFDRWTVKVDTAGVGTWTIVYEYYASTGWTAFTNSSDGTSGFHVAGTNNINWDIPTNWVSNSVNSIEAFWARARVTASSSDLTVRPLGAQMWTNTKTYDIHSKDTVFSSEILTDTGCESTSDVWTAYNIPAVASNLRSTEQVHSGSYSRELIVIDAAGDKGVTQRITISTADYYYRLSGYVWNVDGLSYCVEMHAGDANKIVSENSTSQGEWTYFEMFGKNGTTGDHLSARIVITSTSSATFYIDDFSLTESYLIPYEDSTYKGGTTGVSSTNSFHFLSSGGGGGRDRITLDAYPSSGSLITSDFQGNLTIKARFGDDSFKEEQPDHPNYFNYSVSIKEIQW